MHCKQFLKERDRNLDPAYPSSSSLTDHALRDCSRFERVIEPQSANVGVCAYSLDSGQIFDLGIELDVSHHLLLCPNFVQTRNVHQAAVLKRLSGVERPCPEVSRLGRSAGREPILASIKSLDARHRSTKESCLPPEAGASGPRQERSRLR